MGKAVRKLKMKIEDSVDWFDANWEKVTGYIMSSIAISSGILFALS
jgi:hypothetical protein